MTIITITKMFLNQNIAMEKRNKCRLSIPNYTINKKSSNVILK